MKLTTNEAQVADANPLGASGRAFSRESDIDEFVANVERFERGEMTPDQFRAFRLVRGVYGQRQDDVQMLRVKIPGGVLLPDQIEALADVAAATPRGLAHVTTRQNFQFHFIKLEEVEALLHRLDAVGVTTRGACGNSVRNVTGCAKAGLCSGEAFDTTPYSDAITRHFLRRPLAEGLPRKFKIALSGCSSDCALGAINDIGLIAHRAGDGARRFRVLAAGGLATLPTSAFEIEASYPAERILEVAEALLRIFDRTGNRQNRSRARLKFVVKKLGREEFTRQYREELERVIAEGIAARFVVEESTSSGGPGASATWDAGGAGGAWSLPPIADPALAAFARSNVSPTRHVGRVFVTVKLPVGDATAEQLRALGHLASAFGDHTIRLTVDQNLVFRDVAVVDLPKLHAALVALELGAATVATSADVTSCPGADSCKLAITTSKDLGRQLTTSLAHDPVPGVTVKLSGCPNSCGQHHIATIGLHGGVRKIGGRAAPHYLVMVGGGVGSEGAKFGKVAGKVPARRVHEAIERLLDLARREKGDDETVDGYLRRAEQDVLKAAILDLSELGDAATEEDFVDIGTTAPFRVVEMEGECAA